MMTGFMALGGLVYLAVGIYLLVLATRFVKAVEKFVEKYPSRETT